MSVDARRRRRRCARLRTGTTTVARLLQFVELFLWLSLHCMERGVERGGKNECRGLHVHSMQCLHFPRCPHSPLYFPSLSASPPPFLPAQGSAAYTCMRHLTTQGSGSRSAAAVLANSSSFRGNSMFEFQDSLLKLRFSMIFLYHKKIATLCSHLFQANRRSPSTTFMMPLELLTWSNTYVW